MKQIQTTNAEYLAMDAMSNSELLMMESTPSDFIWNKIAPRDTGKTAALDLGTALHTAILEPEKFNGSFIVYDQTKSRDTVKFNTFMQDVDPNDIVLLESELDKIRLIVASGEAHPTFNHFTKLCTEREQTIIGNYRGADIKIRPDLKCDSDGILCELKTTACIDDWRESALWKNPLFKFNYGHSAAFYMDVYSDYLGRPVNEYRFLLAQTIISKGRYPVAVVKITREELARYGFFDRVHSNISRFLECKESKNWVHDEQFPLFNVPTYEELDISYDD